MTRTSISSIKKEDLINEYITTETVVSSGKLEDFVSDREKTQHIDDPENSDFNEYVESAEDSPIEEVRAVVSK